jgi:esterase/lipase
LTLDRILTNEKHRIKASLKIPENSQANKGVILSHGVMVNRKSLIRNMYCLADYLCKELDAYVIAPDYMGETVHRDQITFNSFNDITNECIDYLCHSHGVEQVMGFGHSMGGYILSHIDNKKVEKIVTYGSPTHVELGGSRKFIYYFSKFLLNFVQTIDMNRLLFIFDHETNQYLKKVMLNDIEFGYEAYNFKLKTRLVREILHAVENYYSNLEKTGIPTLILYGLNDSVVRKSVKHYPDRYTDNNIIVKHIQNASHITPCMETKKVLEKLKPAIDFYRTNPY